MFGCIVAGRLVQTNLQQVDVNKYIFELTDTPSINHIVVFLLGTIPFQPGYAATVHLLWPNKDWQLLGALSNDKASAIFRLRQNNNGRSASTPGGNNIPMTTATLGISIEPIETVQQQLASIQSPNMDATSSSSSSMALTKPAPDLNQVGLMASRILENLYNYVTSFTTQHLPNYAIPLSALTEQGYLPLKAFQTWYDNLGRKLSNDPNYLSSDKNL